MLKTKVNITARTALTMPLFYEVVGVPVEVVSDTVAVLYTVGAGGGLGGPVDSGRTGQRNKLSKVPIYNDINKNDPGWIRHFVETQRLLGDQYDHVDFTPSFTGLTTTGGVNYTGSYYIDRNFVAFSVSIAPDSGVTTSSVLGTTYLNNLPLAAKMHGAVIVNNQTSKALVGNGMIEQDTLYAYLPTWSAVSDTIIITGNYLVER